MDGADFGKAPPVNASMERLSGQPEKTQVKTMNKLESLYFWLACSLRHLFMYSLSLYVQIWIQLGRDGTATVHMQWIPLPRDGELCNNFPTCQNSWTQHVWYCMNIYSFTVWYDHVLCVILNIGFPGINNSCCIIFYKLIIVCSC